MNLITLAMAIALIIINLNLIVAGLNEEFYENWIEKYREISGHRNPPRRFKKWINIAHELNVSVEPSVYKRIFEHLAPFKKSGISVESVKDHLKKIKEMYPKRIDIVGLNTKDMMQARILSGWLYGDSFSLLSKVLDPEIDCYGIRHKFDEGMVIPADDDHSKPYADMADVFGRSEALRSEFGDYANNVMNLQAPTSFHVIPFQAPVFGIYRLRGAADILFATEQTGIGKYENDLHSALNSPTWENKRFAANFRGSATGINYIKAVNESIPLTNSQRFKLHEMSVLQKEGKVRCKVPLDMGISHFLLMNCPRQVLQAIEENYKLFSKQKFEEQFENKYIVVVDGNGAADRTSFYMASGSLIFLSTVNEDWTSNRIIENVHYIKIKPDLSDLIEKLDWAADNDAEARRIAENGKQFALDKLRKPHVKVYNALLFMEYQALFDKNN